MGPYSSLFAIIVLYHLKDVDSIGWGILNAQCAGWSCSFYSLYQLEIVLGTHTANNMNLANAKKQRCLTCLTHFRMFCGVLAQKAIYPAFSILKKLFSVNWNHIPTEVVKELQNELWWYSFPSVLLSACKYKLLFLSMTAAAPWSKCTQSALVTQSDVTRKYDFT